jgi:hypothetical protein
MHINRVKEMGPQHKNRLAPDPIPPKKKQKEVK